MKIRQAELAEHRRRDEGPAGAGGIAADMRAGAGRPRGGAHGFFQHGKGAPALGQGEWARDFIAGGLPAGLFIIHIKDAALQLRD